MHCWPSWLKHQSKFCLLQFRPRTAIKKNRQIDARFRLDAKWLENRREFAEIGTEHPLAELKIYSWSSSFFVDFCLFWAWLLHKIRLLDPHLYRNTLSFLLNTLVGQTPEILLKFVHHIALNMDQNEIERGGKWKKEIILNLRMINTNHLHAPQKTNLKIL